MNENQEWALRIASLWRAGKMIGGDEDEIRDTLLSIAEVVKECNCSHCRWIVERAASQSGGSHDKG